MSLSVLSSLLVCQLYGAQLLDECHSIQPFMYHSSRIHLWYRCVLCQFVHTPFLALALGVALLASVLGVCLLGTRLESIWSCDHLCLAQLRAPPADTLA